MGHDLMYPQIKDQLSTLVGENLRACFRVAYCLKKKLLHKSQELTRGKEWGERHKKSKTLDTQTN